jgi:hypothetical protein
VFGLFGKEELPNGTFNNALIAAISDSVRQTGKFPSESALLSAVNDITKNKKITPNQVNAIRCCALEINSFSWGESELMPLIKKMQTEIPRGGRESYDKVVQLFAQYGIITTDEGIDFMKKYGL